MYAAGAASVLAVVAGTSAAGDARLLAEASSTDANPPYCALLVDPRVTTYLTEYIRNDVLSVRIDHAGNQAPSAFNGTLNQMSVVDSGSTWNKYVNGAAAGAPTYTRSGSLTLSTFALGALVRTTVAAYFAGKVSEVLVYTTELSTADRQSGEPSQKAYFGTP